MRGKLAKRPESSERRRPSASARQRTPTALLTTDARYTRVQCDISTCSLMRGVLRASASRRRPTAVSEKRASNETGKSGRNARSGRRSGNANGSVSVSASVSVPTVNGLSVSGLTVNDASGSSASETRPKRAGCGRSLRLRSVASRSRL